MAMEYEWDKNKSVSNLSKHRVTFDEAITAFDDPFFVDFHDPDHSYDEHRYIIIGKSKKNRVLLVAYKETKNTIRIISARKATQKERKIYEEG